MYLLVYCILWHSYTIFSDIYHFCSSNHIWHQYRTWCKQATGSNKPSKWVKFSQMQYYLCAVLPVYCQCTMHIACAQFLINVYTFNFVILLNMYSIPGHTGYIACAQCCSQLWFCLECLYIPQLWKYIMIAQVCLPFHCPPVH